MSFAYKLKNLLGFIAQLWIGSCKDLSDNLRSSMKRFKDTNKMLEGYKEKYRDSYKPIHKLEHNSNAFKTLRS